MRGSALQIGPLKFRDFEIPQFVHFGGRHRTVFHTLSTGERLVERLGPDEDSIQFRGIFSGRSAEERVRAVDSLRVTGDIIWLTWGSFRRRVLIKSFRADFENSGWIPYQITCLVIANPIGTFAPQASIASLLSSDLANALSVAAMSSVSLSLLKSALVNRNVSTAITSGRPQVIGVVESTLESLDSQIIACSNVIGSSPLPTEGTDGVLPFLSLVDQAGALASAVNARSYVGRIGMSLRQVGI